MVCRSVPASSKCKANPWRSECDMWRLRIPERSRAWSQVLKVKLSDWNYTGLGHFGLLSERLGQPIKSGRAGVASQRESPLTVPGPPVLPPSPFRQ